MKIGFRKKPQEKPILAFNIIFWCISIFSFIFLNYLGFFFKLKEISNPLQYLSSPDSPILKNIISQNQTISKLITSSNKILNSSGNIFSGNEVENLIELYTGNQNLLNKYFPQYSQANKFFVGISKYENEIFELAGKTKPQTYVILLMNNSEKRPFGGFFGSFIEATFSGGHLTRKLNDSYWIKSLDQTGVNLDSSLKSYIPSQKINFIGGNEFGFSDIDGKNLLQIYSQVFPEKNIAGVIFLNSDFIKNILKDYDKKHIEWEFVNASVDLISGKFEAEKKKFYRSDANNYISQNFDLLAKGAIKNFSSFKNYVKVYIPTASSGLNDFFTQNGLTNIFDSGYIYAFDYNDSFDKIDEFVDKKIYLQNQSGDTIGVYTGEKIPLFQNGKKLSGNYKLKIYYFLNVPSEYENYISSLEKSYNISLTPREKHILGLTYEWGYRSTIVGENINFGDIFGQKDSDIFQAYGKNYLYYTIYGTGNNQFKSLEINFSVK